MGSITSFNKQVIVFFLFTALIIRPTFAANVGSWTLSGGVPQGASVVYEGTKNIVLNGADYIKKGTAIVTPTATGVAKVLARGGAGYALSVAVDELLGAVDWVLDPANNRIKYKDSSASPCATPQNCSQYLNLYHNGNYPHLGNFASAAAAAIAIYETNGWSSATFHSIYSDSGKEVIVALNVRDKNTGQVYDPGSETEVVFGVANPACDPNAEAEEKYLPLPAVAEKVISNAATGDTNAQVATTAAAADIVSEAEKDVKARPIAQQLESSASTKPADEAAAAEANTATGTQTQNPTKPEVKDIALEFPAFCGWASIVCEFAQTANQAIADAKAEYSDKPQENTDTELEIPDPEEQSIDSDISFGGSCPATLTSQVNFMGINETIEFSFEPVCEIAQFIKPVVISISAFSAALIVAGIRTEED